MSSGERPVSAGYRLRLGGFEFELLADSFALLPPLEASYEAFLLPAAVQTQDAVRIRFTLASHMAAEGRHLFGSDATWSLLADGDERAFVMREPGSSEPLYVARFRPGARDIAVTCSPRLLEMRPSGNALRSPFHYPLDQILVMYLLGADGLILHAAGAVWRGAGVAFLGVSGAGKSTIAGLLAGRPGWEPLSDDRVILRRAAGQSRIWGTPWPGEAGVARDASAPVRRLFFLEQGAADEVRALPAREALSRLARTASLPWFDADHVDRGLAACDWVLASIPPSVFRFKPTAAAVDALERALGEAPHG